MADVTSRSAPQPDDPLWRMRWFMFASGVSVLAAVALIASTPHTAWKWPPFVWGVGIGLFGLAVLQSAFAIGRTRFEIPAEREMRFRRRQYIYIPGWIVSGVVIGTVAAAFDAVWIDIVGTAYVLLTLIAGFIIAAVVIRRRGISAQPR